ncbi:MAG: hypothetical protein UU67_C0057G0003 [Candidatus Daviesbacteria bacterium GW2011_GWB1_41_5]|uniref:Uncharacterized protein n=1 Tax=Candidatus Daviesbacteria bacterium GW2011_GWB1_41_5 TaxID=1618429 RepID=A0A0G0WJE2_9BACT|nr:MAG: hypothetical protein UU67_C0057G0003 [Candidatus Daviesbacteria bacterium GW2011_GWB1_41_5]
MTPSKHFLPIEDIRGDLIILKNGNVALVLSTSAVNFALLFETEQISIIESFAGLLNSLSFPIQISIMSRRLDVSSYLTTLEQAKARQSNPLLRAYTDHFRGFVESIIKENNVLDKQFYVTISASGTELGIGRINLQEKLRRAATILSPRRDHLIKQLSRLGIKAHQLNTVELVKLFYSIYNPNTETVNPPATSATPHPKLARLAPPPPITPSPPTTARPVGGPTNSPLSPPFVVEELPDE